MRNGNRRPPSTRNSRPRVEPVRTKPGNVWIGFASNTFCGSDSPNRRLLVLAIKSGKTDHCLYDNCNKAIWLVRLVGSMRDSRDFSRVLRIGFCCSEQQRRNLKTRGFEK